MNEPMGAVDAECHHQEATEEELVEPSVQEVIQAIEKKLLESNDKYVRLYAEFDNFKKRTAKERIALTTHANEKTLRELLPIVDDFERSIAAWQQSQDAVQEAMQVGMQYIYDKLLAFLKKYGVEPMALEAGHAFDTDFHEAIMQKPAESPEMQGKISSVIEKGYLINGNVLRCAKVVIGL
jgi:molecular chaperone GrpE